MYNITDYCDQFPINKISLNKNEKLTTKFTKVLCLDCMVGVLELIPRIFLTKNFAKRIMQHLVGFQEIFQKKVKIA